MTQPRVSYPRYHELITSTVEVLDNGCWQWLGKIDANGYGYGPGGQGAHRASYLTFVGPIPRRLVIDHKCHSYSDCEGGTTCPHRSCVNPEHLEPVTQRENIRRGVLGRRFGLTVEWAVSA